MAFVNTLQSQMAEKNLMQETPQSTEGIDVGKILRKEQNLTYIDSLPAPRDISQIHCHPFIGAGSKQSLSSEEFTQILSTATMLQPTDSIIFNWHYAPQYSLSVVTKKGQYSIMLYLGGLAFVKLPSGSVGAFKFEPME